MASPRDPQREADKAVSASVVSVRMPTDQAEALQEVASKRGIAISALIREAVEGYLEADIADGASTSTRDLSITSPSGAPVTFYSRPSSSGRTAGNEADLHVDTRAR